MKLWRVIGIFLPVFAVLGIALSAISNAKQIEKNEIFLPANLKEKNFVNDFHNLEKSRHFGAIENGHVEIIKKPIDGGIVEDIPKKFLVRYKKWKDELLSTEFGRRQWENYAANKNFVLTVSVSDEEKQGAGTGKYQWDDTGILVGATITLGGKLDKGYPDPIYFPVMNSLSLETLPTVKGEILAAAKFAHEFGHVNQTARTNSELFRRQNKLMPDYNSILLKNGYNTNDQKLIDLVAQMGGTPVKIWEDREYWGELNAMNFLVERIDKENFYCPVFSRLKNNINLYAKDYEPRFNEIVEAHSSSAACRK